MVFEAVKVALDPTPAQERLLLSHAGAARFAFNAWLAHVKDALHVVDRWFASSKTCSKCGRVKAKLSLAERVYRCDGCGLVMDRDLNAAVNILVAGSAPETQNTHRVTGSRSNQHGCATQVPVKCEPSRRSGKPRRLGADERKHVLQAKSSSLQRYSTGAW